MTLRSQYDREIVRLALPALGALAAEPLYLLVDTAIVGHLGRSQLAALGIAAVLLGGWFAVFNFLQYATTAQVARAAGAGEDETARRLGGQALWLSVALGLIVAAFVAATAVPLVSAMGDDGATADYAVTYLRIAVLGLPAAFVALGGSGYLRGVSDLRTPLVVVVAGNVANVVLEIVFVYGFDWGIRGSAWGTVVAQLGMGAAFVVVLLRALRPGEARLALGLARRLLSLGKWIFVRTAARSWAPTFSREPWPPGSGTPRSRPTRSRRSSGSSSRSSSTRWRSRDRSSSAASSAPGARRRRTARASA